MIASLRNIFTPPDFTTDQFPDLGRTLHNILLVILLGLIYPVCSNLHSLWYGSTNAFHLALILITQLIVTVCCFALNKHGYSRSVAKFLPMSFVPFQYILVSTTQFNVYDVAMWTYGPTFILASSLLDKRWYITFTTLQLMAITAHYAAELQHQSIPDYSQAKILNDYVDSISINTVTAIGAFLLSGNVLRNYRRAQKHALAAEVARQRLDLIFETIPAGIAIFDADGSITFANRTAKEVFELSDVPGTGDRGSLTWRMVSIDQQEIPPERTPHRMVLKSGRPLHDHRIGLRFLDGRSKALSVSCAPWSDDGLQGVIASFWNITDLVTIQEELTMRREQIASITANLHSVIYRVRLEKGKLIKPVFISDGAKELFGYTPEEMMQDIRKFMGSIYRPDAMNDIRLLRELSEQPRPFDYEYRVVRRNGEVRWQRNSGTPFIAADGTVYVDGFVLDITDRKEAEQQITMLGEAVTRSSEVVFMTDIDGRFAFVNPRFTELYGYTAEEAIGKLSPKVLELHPHPTVTHEMLWNELGQQRAVNTIFQNRTKDGLEVEVECSITPIIDGNGLLQGYLSIQHDISERRRLEDSIQHTKKMESLSILAGGVAHEFNNLLTTILGRASMLQTKTEKGTPPHAGFVKIEEAALRASELTRQLLAYSGRSKFEVRLIDLNDIIRENLHSLTASSTGSVQVQPRLTTPPGHVRADIRQMKQLVVNLVTNAMEAMQGRPGSVCVRTSAAIMDDQLVQEWSTLTKTTMMPGTYIILEVEDQGNGMSSEVMERMFDPFFSTKFTGRGLGLSAVMGIVQGHHGGIKVRSQMGSGTVFSVALPVYQQATELTAVTPVSKNAGLVVIDDQELNLELLKDICESNGIPCRTATSCAETEEHLRIHHASIAMVLMDVNIPGSNCRDNLERVRAAAPKVPVVLMSGLSADAIPELTGTVYDSFLQKPYTEESLLTLYRRFTEP